MKGYWQRPEDTAETLVDGWLRSGDAGYRSAEGFIYVCDRVKDMICRGGENIYTAEVESAIHGHPDVAEIAVVGVPDPHWGEAVRAVVVPRTGAVVDPESVIARAGERIACYKLPRSVVVVDELPIDLFLNSTDFHEGIATRIRWETFAGKSLPFLSCFDLAVFKAFFNRTRDWADLEEIARAGTLDKARVQATLIGYLGAEDERIAKLTKL